MAAEQVPDTADYMHTFGQIYDNGQLVAVNPHPPLVMPRDSESGGPVDVFSVDLYDRQYPITEGVGLRFVRLESAQDEDSSRDVESARVAVGEALGQEQPEDERRQTFLRRHRRALLLGGAALALAGTEVIVSAATGASVQGVITEVAREGRWAAPVLAVTEAVTTAGFFIAALGIGMKIGNPLTLPRRLAAVREQAANNPVYRWGMRISGVGALASAGVAAAATWMSGIPLSAKALPSLLLAGDAAETVVSRKFLLPARTNAHETASTQERQHDIQVRLATEDDIDALVALDLRLFRRAYGKNSPDPADVAKMFRERLRNNPDGMFVAVVDGKIKGFATAFRTDKPVEAFTSWEDSTAHGTLEGRVDPNGRYLYIANLTVDTHDAGGAIDALIVSIFAKGIEDGVEYGYFCSRIPGFKRWAMSHAPEFARRINEQLPEGQPARTAEQCLSDPEVLDDMAREYVEERHDIDSAGTRTRPFDPELAFYESVGGLERQRPVHDAFDDDASMNYQVPFVGRVPLPGYRVFRHITPVRKLVASGLRALARHPKLLSKVL